MSEATQSGQKIETATGAPNAKVIAAFVKAKAKMGAALKQSTNPHFGSKFADLASVFDVTQAPFAEFGLALRQEVEVVSEGVCVRTFVMHESGEELASPGLCLPVAQKTPQGYGSTITYTKRYDAQSFLGIASDDDDGNAASSSSHPPAPAGTKALAETMANGKTLRQHPNLMMGKIGTAPGAKLADLSDDQVSEYRALCKASLANPEKEKFHKTEAQRLEIFNLELTYRGLPVE